MNEERHVLGPNPVSSLGLDMNHRDVPEWVLKELELRARRIGLPLSELELLGQDFDMTAAFIDAADKGEPWEFLATVDFERLAQILHGRETRMTELTSFDSVVANEEVQA